MSTRLNYSLTYLTLKLSHNIHRMRTKLHTHTSLCMYRASEIIRNEFQNLKLKEGIIIALRVENDVFNGNASARYGIISYHEMTMHNVSSVQQGVLTI